MRWPCARAESAAVSLHASTLKASGSATGFGPEGAIDGDRFAAASGSAWKGKEGQLDWWWQIRFASPQQIGSILQIGGDHEFVFRDAPKRYVWQWSRDGKTWRNIPETQTENERRTFRIHRLALPRRTQYLRLYIVGIVGRYPTLREIEFYPEPGSTIEFPDWAVMVSTLDKPDLPAFEAGFTQLARQCKGWERLAVQHVWLDSFDEAFIAAEPRPLCAFLSGNLKDWCQVAREPWRGVQEVLKNRNLPIWAACGGAQGLAILSTVGVDKPWDCPHCRDPKNPKAPVYTHIGHTARKPCGDYSGCIGERGTFNVLQVADDPVFEGLPREFKIEENHCGQIEWIPPGWTLIATRGRGGKTKTQCMRVKDRYIYAAQFHMELFGKTPENSRRIMGNFLSLAKQWGGYNPEGKSVPQPRASSRPTSTRSASQPAACAAVIVTVGDSTVCDYPPERKIYGWGQMLGEFFDDDVRIVNLAQSGRSSKSFIREGRWDKALAVKPDYVFIQFGHNDCPGKGDRTTDPNSDYMDNLRKYVDDTRRIGAEPILVTPVSRRTFGANGKIADSLSPYVRAMIRVGAEKRVPVIDLNARSVELFERLGDAGSAHLSCAPGDRTHFSAQGARAMAKIVAEGLYTKVPNLQCYLKLGD